MRFKAITRNQLKTKKELMTINKKIMQKSRKLNTKKCSKKNGSKKRFANIVEDSLKIKDFYKKLLLGMS